MSPRRVATAAGAWLLAVLLVGTAAGGTAESSGGTGVSSAAPEAGGKPAEAVFKLNDGSRFSGRAAVTGVTIDTAYGRLQIPVAEIYRLRVASAADGETKKKIAALVARLGASNFDEREKASDELLGLGAVALEQLRTAAKAEDAEVRTRAEKLVAGIEGTLSGEDDPEAQLVGEEDEVVTRRFTARGRLNVQTFEVLTDYGRLDVPRNRVVCVTFGAPEAVVRRFELTGLNTTRSILKTGLTVRAGSRLRFSCEGSIHLDDEGADCGPEGNAQVWGQNVQGFPGNAVIGRIGHEGPFFMIGKGAVIRAESTGELELLVAYQNSVGGSSGSFTVKIDVEGGR